jgi:hypothetical protein
MGFLAPAAKARVQGFGNIGIEGCNAKMKSQP